MILKKGSRGDYVICLQNGLTLMCIDPNGHDGIFGAGTENAVIRFQKKFGLNADGIVGQATWEKLKNQIRPIQSALNDHNYKIAVDGVAGGRTIDAVKHFQNNHNLTADGMVGTATWKILRTTSGSHSSSESSQSFTGYVSDSCVEFIKTYEAFYSRPYRDVGGVLTIGYGSTHGWIMKKSSVTKEEATRALKEEINECANQIKKSLNSKGVNLNQHQFDALCSFAYNCGASTLLDRSTLYKRICAGVRDSSLKSNFEAYKTVNHKLCQGLLNRRRDEYEMFMYGDYKRNH